MFRTSGEGHRRAQARIRPAATRRAFLSRWGGPLTVCAFTLSAGLVAVVTVHSRTAEFAGTPYRALPYRAASAPPAGALDPAPGVVPVPLAEGSSHPKATGDSSSPPAPAADGSGGSAGSSGSSGSAQHYGVFGKARRAVPALGLSPGSVSFDAQPVGSPGTTRTVTVASSGSAPLRVRAVSVSGANTTAFAVTGDHCSGVTLNPGQSCPVGVSFTPDLPGTRTAALTIAGDGAGSATTTLSGVATDAPITATGLPVDCGQSTASRCVVDSIFRDLLGRSADDSALQNYAAQLDSGQTTRQQVATAVVNTDEWRTREVGVIFKELLGRSPDSASLAYYVGQLRSQSVEQVTANLAASQEYFTRAGSTNDGYVTTLYKDVLHNSGDSAGRAGWVDQLNRGASRASVAASIRRSAEGEGVVVDAAYRALLARSPSPAERANLSNAMVHGLSEQSMLGSLVQTDEYMDDAAPLALSDVPLATFVDGDPHASAGDFAATIDWGDGSQPSAATLKRGKSGYQVIGSHTYSAHRSWTVTIHITHNGGSQAQTTTTVVV